MNVEAMNRLRVKLVERRDELNAELDHLRAELLDLSIEQDAEGGGAGNHFADDGSSLGEQERISTAEANFREQLGQIGQALTRMDEGDYGRCQRCGREVPEERLEALPYAAYCIDCQKFLEEQVALYGVPASL